MTECYPEEIMQENRRLREENERLLEALRERSAVAFSKTREAERLRKALSNLARYVDTAYWASKEAREALTNGS